MGWSDLAVWTELGPGLDLKPRAHPQNNNNNNNNKSKREVGLSIGLELDLGHGSDRVELGYRPSMK